MDDFQHLLQLRDERREAVPDPRIDAIVAQVKTELVASLRKAIGELNRIDCERRPALSARVSSEIEWIEAVRRVFGAPDA